MSVVDQYEYVPLPISPPTPDDPAGFWYIKRSGSNVIKQTFKPAKNSLDKVYVYLNGNGSSATVTMAIKDAAANSVGSMSASAPSSTNGAWVLFDFSTDLSFTPEAIYQIILTTTSTTAYWRIDKTPEYTRGNAVVDGVVKTTQNFGFATYGYDAAASPPPATPPADTPASPAPVAPSTSPSPPADEPIAPGVTIIQSENVATATAEKTDADKATKSAAKAPATTTETKGIFENPIFPFLAALLVIAVGAGIGFMAKKKKKTEKAEPEKTETPLPTDTPQT